MPDTTEQKQYVRDPKTGGLLTVANVAADARVAPQKQPAVLRPALAGALGLLTILAAAPGAMLAGFLASGTAPPLWLATAAAIGTGLSSLLAAGAYWAAGGNPLDILKRFAPKIPGAAAPSDGALEQPSDSAQGNGRAGPPEA
jgi:hypothetical protein